MPRWKNMAESLVAAHLRTACRPLIVVLGPTASGKTAFSLTLARRMNTLSLWKRSVMRGMKAEIVNADSRQLYRGMDIGTAKVTRQERQDIPHHLFSVLDPDAEATVAWYRKRATTTIDDVLERGHVPILVGGSPLYLSSVIDGLQPLPRASRRLHMQLLRAYDRDPHAVYRRLMALDPDAAVAIHLRNKVYVIRALELCVSLGRPASQAKRKVSCPYDLLIFGMDVPRAQLLRQIEKRARAMLRCGWIIEVRRLLARGYRSTNPGFLSHGYREIAERIQKTQRTRKRLHGMIVDERLAETIIVKTRQYSKRQMTWWRRDLRIHWVRPDILGKAR